MTELAVTAQGHVAYSVSGDGVPLVLLPGFQTASRSWQEPSDYLGLLAGFKVIRIDPLGHGDSSRSHDEADYTSDNVVGHVTAVLDAESIDRAHIWGFSRGGQIAALCAELTPQRCLSAVLGATPLGTAWDIATKEIVELEPYLASGDWDSYWAQWSGNVDPVIRERLEERNDPQANAAALRASLKWADEHPRFGLNRCQVPRLAYFGPGEPWAKDLRRELATSDLTVHEGPWQEHTDTLFDAHRVVAIVVPFLRSH